MNINLNYVFPIRKIRDDSNFKNMGNIDTRHPQKKLCIRSKIDIIYIT